MPAWTLLYEARVVKRDIPALDSNVKRRIQEAIQTKLLRDPLTFGKPLQYSLAGQRSLRVGDYRVLYVLEHDMAIIRITAIRHRRDVYEG